MPEIRKRGLELEPQYKAVLAIRSRSIDGLFSFLSLWTLVITFMLGYLKNDYTAAILALTLFIQPVILIFILYRFVSNRVFEFYREAGSLYLLRLVGVAFGLVAGVALGAIVVALPEIVGFTELNILGVHLSMFLVACMLTTPAIVYFGIDIADHVYVKLNKGKSVPDYE